MSFASPDSFYDENYPLILNALWTGFEHDDFGDAEDAISKAIDLRGINDFAQKWARSRAGELITGLSKTAALALKRTMAASFREGWSKDETTNAVAKVIGLDDRYAEAAENYRQSLLSKGMPRNKAWQMTQEYANQLRYARAKSIASYETVAAFTAAKQEIWKEAVELGELDPDSRRIWKTAKWDRRCKYCIALDGKDVPLQGGVYKSMGKAVHGPPLHPNCRCYEVVVSKNKVPITKDFSVAIEKVRRVKPPEAREEMFAEAASAIWAGITTSQFTLTESIQTIVNQLRHDVRTGEPIVKERRVKTPEGARLYDQPINSIIRRDIVPDLHKPSGPVQHFYDSTGARRWGQYGGAGVLFRSPSGKYFLAQRGGGIHNSGSWSTPGGAIDEGETPLEAVIRETKEEVGYDGPFNVVGTHVFQPADDWAYTTFIVDVPEEFDPSGLDWETTAGAWYTPEEMQNLDLFPGFKNSLPQLISKKERRVKTPDGAKLYDQPIGSIIHRDVPDVFGDSEPNFVPDVPDLPGWFVEKQQARLDEMGITEEDMIGHMEEIFARSDINDRNWYPKVHALAAQWAHKFDLDMDTIATVIAAISPGKVWEQNEDQARAILEVMTGDPNAEFVVTQKDADIYNEKKPAHLPFLEPGIFKVGESTDRNLAAHHPVIKKANNHYGIENAERAVRVLRGEDPDTVLTGPKTRNFFNNIMWPEDTANADVTVDVWMLRAMYDHQKITKVTKGKKGQPDTVETMSAMDFDDVKGLATWLHAGGSTAKGKEIPSIGLYPIHAAAIRKAAADHGLSPMEYQAIVWSQFVRENPKAKNSAAKKKRKAARLARGMKK